MVVSLAQLAILQMRGAELAAADLLDRLLFGLQVGLEVQACACGRRVLDGLEARYFVAGAKAAYIGLFSTVLTILFWLSEASSHRKRFLQLLVVLRVIAKGRSQSGINLYLFSDYRSLHAFLKTARRKSAPACIKGTTFQFV